MIRALLAVLVLLAGCSAPAPEPPEDEVVPSPPVLEPPVVAHANGNTVAGMWEGNVLGEGPSLLFEATGNTTAILVEVTWDDPMQDLDARATADVPRCPYGLPDDVVCMADGLVALTPMGEPGFQFGVFQEVAGGPGQGDSPSRLLIEGDRLRAVMEACGSPCEWTAQASARAPVADVAWDIWVSVFSGPVPEGYTAIPD